jgi:hypothetical protein
MRVLGVKLLQAPTLMLITHLGRLRDVAIRQRMLGHELPALRWCDVGKRGGVCVAALMLNDRHGCVV